MGAAAELGGVPSCLEHPDDVAVLVSEERDRAELGGLGLGGLVVADRAVREDLGVGQVLDLLDLGLGEGIGRPEVEAQPLGIHQRTLLLHALAEHRAERPVEDVGAGVVPPDGVTASDVDARRGLLARLDRALDADLVAVQPR